MIFGKFLTVSDDVPKNGFVAKFIVSFLQSTAYSLDTVTIPVFTRATII